MADETKPQEFPILNIEDRDELRKWLKSVKTTPPAGYDAMTHPDGTPFTDEEQIETFINQTLEVVEFKRKRGYPEDQIKQMLTKLAQPKDEGRSTP